MNIEDLQGLGDQLVSRMHNHMHISKKVLTSILTDMHEKFEYMKKSTIEEISMMLGQDVENLNYQIASGKQKTMSLLSLEPTNTLGEGLMMMITLVGVGLFVYMMSHTDKYSSTLRNKDRFVIPEHRKKKSKKGFINYIKKLFK